jgi:hypothetical protein
VLNRCSWLKKDLAAVDRKKTPWVIAMGHRPWYVSGTNVSSTVCLECQQAFEPIFVEYGVDLIMQGHVHAYQRNKPMANCGCGRLFSPPLLPSPALSSPVLSCPLLSSPLLKVTCP